MAASPLQDRVALITGAAHRTGATIARTLHDQGMRVIVHYHRSRRAAEALVRELNTERPDSAASAQANLLDTQQLTPLVQTAECWGRLDALINNASSFYRTSLGEITQAQWADLMGTNLKAPLFLSQAAAPQLAAVGGTIINIVDIHAERPLKGFSVYCAAKAGLAMLTKSLARELGPRVRVNGVAPGAILWPEQDPLSDTQRDALIERTALKRQGDPQDIADMVAFLVREGTYVTGQVIAVDGGRSLHQ